MAKLNRMDRVTDLTKERIGRVVANATKQFKGANPYRQEPVSKQDRITQFLRFSPDVIQKSRQIFGDEMVNSYINKMNNLIREQKP